MSWRPCRGAAFFASPGRRLGAEREAVRAAEAN